MLSVIGFIVSVVVIVVEVVAVAVISIVDDGFCVVKGCFVGCVSSDDVVVVCLVCVAKAVVVVLLIGSFVVCFVACVVEIVGNKSSVMNGQT